MYQVACKGVSNSQDADNQADNQDVSIEDAATLTQADAGLVADITDELPKDLNVSEYVGPYLFPNNSRRRIPAIIYLSIAAVCIVLWAVASNSPLVNSGFLGVGIALAAFGVYGLVCGRELQVDESEALLVAVAAVGFPVGHASAQMGWRGWLSRPIWRILLYSNEPQPAQRGLVFVDGISGTVIDQLVQPNPEDWAEL